jgi:gliding motility-associated protein GldL
MSNKNQKFDKDKIVNAVVSIGAAVVIFGAWAKILHKSFADTMLTVGLLTEAAIFIVYAFYHPKDPLADLGKTLEGGLGKNSNTPGFDMLKDTIEKEISQENLKKLNESFSKFNTTVQSMSAMGDVSAATVEYTNKTKEATAALQNVKEAYSNAASSLQTFNKATEGSEAFSQQVQNLTKNLGSLNKMYEMELEGAGSHIKSMNTFYEKLGEVAQNMQSSVDDAKKTQEQIALLAKNLGSLNNVYGNMLAAMQGRA